MLEIKAEKLRRHATNVFLLPLDIILSLALCIVVVLPGVLMLSVTGRGRRTVEKPEERSILFLSSASNVQATYQKFGDFKLLFSYNPKGFFRHVYCSWFPAPNCLEIALREDYTVLETRLIRGLAIASLVLYLAKLYRLVRLENVSLIRAWDPYYNGLIAVLLSKLTHIPFCVSIHADHDQRYRVSGSENSVVLFGSRKLAKKMEKFVLTRADRVLPIRESIAKNVISVGVSAERVRVIPHGIDVEPFLQHPDLGLKRKLGIEGKKVVSFVGRLYKDNYTDDIVRIAAEVNQTRGDTVFLLVGDGEQRDHLEQLSRTLCPADGVRFIGFQPQEKVAQIRLISDVSLCLMAGFSLIEAAVAGTPIVSYDVEWHYELVRNGETGFLLPEGDIQGAADAILKLLGDTELSKWMGENARRLAIAGHSRENTDKIVVQWYEELINLKEDRQK